VNGDQCQDDSNDEPNEPSDDNPPGILIDAPKGNSNYNGGDEPMEEGQTTGAAKDAGIPEPTKEIDNEELPLATDDKVSVEDEAMHPPYDESLRVGAEQPLDDESPGVGTEVNPGNTSSVKINMVALDRHI
jgi:hypothetical protein